MTAPTTDRAAPDLKTRVTALLLAIAPDLPDTDLPPDAWYSKHYALALELTSLQVVQLVDLIEASFDLVLSSLDVTRAHFATPASLATRLRQRGAG